jgi:hypothetical protein
MKFKREPKQSSKEIIELLKQGVSQRQIAKRGYPESTIRYYFMKMHKPKQFTRYIKRVQVYQKNAKDREEEQS